MAGLSFDFDWGSVTFNLVHLGVAFLLAIPVALDREKASRSAGLRIRRFKDDPDEDA